MTWSKSRKIQYQTKYRWEYLQKNPALLSSAVERTAFMKTALTTTLIKMGSYNSSANLH